MNKRHLADFVRGWFVGDFEPNVLRRKDIEIAVQNYSTGDAEPLHLHKIAQEITVIAKGKVKMSGVEYSTGDIVIIPPGQATDFEVLEDTVTVVVKTPSVIGDKYLEGHSES